MAMQYEVTYGSQCPKRLEIKKTSKNICEKCPYKYQAYHTFSWCSDVKRTPSVDLIDWDKMEEDDKKFDREEAEKEYRDHIISIRCLLKRYPDLVALKID